MTGLRTERSFQQRLEREHRLFHKRKINNNKNEKNKIEYNTKPKKNLVTNEWEHLKRNDRLEDFSYPP